MCSTRIVECNLSKCFMDTTRIGSFDIDNKLGEMTYEIFITSNDFRVPCVHIKSKNVLIGVGILNPIYITHIDSYNQFSLNEFNAFGEFVKAPSKQKVFTVGDKEYKLRTNWDYIIARWNEENLEFPITIEMDSDGYMISPDIPNYGELC